MRNSVFSFTSATFFSTKKFIQTGHLTMSLGDYGMESYLKYYVVLFIVFVNCAICYTEMPYPAEAPLMGINYGTQGDDLPTPELALHAIESMKLGRVKIFSPDPEILSKLTNSGMEVVVTIPTNDIPGIAASQDTADAWVKQNILNYWPTTNFVTILVGNEIFSYPDLQSTWTQLVPAMQNLNTSLHNNDVFNSKSIKISTAAAVDILATSYPPSSGAFRDDIADSVMIPLLKFLSATNSYLYMNVYPFLAYASSGGNITLDYALFGNVTVVEDSGLKYTNLFDAQLDAVNAAMARVGYGDVRIAVGETGWPTQGDANQIGASIENAATYNSRLVAKILDTKNFGTPLRPSVFIPTFIFALFNENQKPGALSERNWGLLYPNLTSVYPIDFTPKPQGNQSLPPTPPPSNPNYPIPPVAAPSSQIYATSRRAAPSSDNYAMSPTTSSYDISPSGAPAMRLAPPGPVPSTSPAYGIWCVSNTAADPTSLEAALNYACAAIDCSAIELSQRCYAPNTMASHASWAFNSYWQEYKSVGGTCDFGGAAVLTNIDPSETHSPPIYSLLCFTFV